MNKPAPLTILRELPTQEELTDSPALKPGMKFQSLLKRKDTTSSDYHPGSPEDKPKSLTELHVIKSQSEPGRKFTKLEIPPRIRKDEEFTLSSPLSPYGKRKVSITVKNFESQQSEESETPEALINGNGKPVNNKENGQGTGNYEMAGLLNFNAESDKMIEECYDE